MSKDDMPTQGHGDVGNVTLPGADANTNYTFSVASDMSKHDITMRRHGDAGNITLQSSNTNYTFSVASDDGAVLWIDGGAALVNNSGAIFACGQGRRQRPDTTHRVLMQNKIGIDP